MGRVTRNFRCPHCGTIFHIQRNCNGHYVRFMPPAYCPGCGSATGDVEDHGTEEEVEDDDGTT